MSRRHLDNDSTHPIELAAYTGICLFDGLSAGDIPGGASLLASPYTGIGLFAGPTDSDILGGASLVAAPA